MVSFFTRGSQPAKYRRLTIVIALSALAWIVAQPHAFVGLWLTPDQQGALWFELGDYEKASRSFEDPRWRGFSFYADQEFDKTARYFAQFQDAESLVIQANALAHQRKYESAKSTYRVLAKLYPDHPSLKVNLPVIDKLIEATQQAPANQEDEEGRRNAKPGKGSQVGAKGEYQKNTLEQYSAEELTQDPELTEMWLRQIQRDPSEFITTKFYLQLEQSEGEAQ